MNSPLHRERPSTAAPSFVLQARTDLECDPLLADIHPTTDHAALVSVFTAALSFALYAGLFGVPIALGVMAGLAMHEAGHLWVLRRLGLPGSPPIFVPLLGATVNLKRTPLRPRDQLRLALAGPAFGLVYSAGCIAVGVATDMGVPILLGGMFAFVNGFDLLPIGPLDGARALQAWQSIREAQREGPVASAPAAPAAPTRSDRPEPSLRRWPSDRRPRR